MLDDNFMALCLIAALFYCIASFGYSQVIFYIKPKNIKNNFIKFNTNKPLF